MESLILRPPPMCGQDRRRTDIANQTIHLINLAASAMSDRVYGAIGVSRWRQNSESINVA